ncbi:MAG: RNA polymerase sigma factor [Prevotella sp.]|nr:RNA polymerase sigma factor [Prevotella sp.]
MSSEDLSLVTQVAVFHNKRAFDKLVMKYQSLIRRFFLGQTLGDKQLSDDLAQDTFVKAYTNIGQFKGLSNFSTWLYRIAYNVLYDHNRCTKLTETIDQPAVVRRHSEQADSGLRMDLAEALAILSPAERTCITLQLMEGQPINKIAEVTGMAESTIKSHLSRGKQKLANYLKNNGYDRK